MQPIDPNSFLPTRGERETAKCGQCGITGLPHEMHRASLPVAGSLPTLPNAVSWRCRDEAGCIARIANRHRNDALLTSDDPLYAAGNVLDRIREDIARVDQDLAAVQDGIGRARVRYLQEPDDATVERAARVLARWGSGTEQAADDPEYHRVARAMLKAALYDAEEPIDPEPPLPPGVSAEVLEAVTRALSDAMEDENPSNPSTLVPTEGLARAALAAIPRSLWKGGSDEGECIETRPSTRGDCDGPMVKAELVKANAFGLPDAQANGLVGLCRAHWQQAYRAGEVGTITYPGRVWIREEHRP